MPDCPYGAGECPKLADLKADIKDLRESVRTLVRLVFIMAGIMLAQLGVQIF